MSYNKYWEADDLLMSNESVNTIAEVDIYGLNFQEKIYELGDFNEDNVIREGNKSDIPIWFAGILKDNGFSNIKQPKYMTDKYFNLLSADPTFVNLKSKNLFFYEICTKLLSHFKRDDEHEDYNKWPKLLAQTMHRRYLHLLRNSVNVVYENHSLTKVLSLKENMFYDKMVKINKNVKFFLENYENKNKNLDEILEIKKVSKKTKKFN